MITAMGERWKKTTVEEDDSGHDGFGLCWHWMLTDCRRSAVERWSLEETSRPRPRLSLSRPGATGARGCAWPRASQGPRASCSGGSALSADRRSCRAHGVAAIVAAAAPSSSSVKKKGFQYGFFFKKKKKHFFLKVVFF